MKRLIISIISVGALTSWAQTPGDTILTLEQCTDLAVKYNAELKTAANNAEAAVQLRREAFTKYFPEVSATGMAFWANHDIVQYNVMNLVELGLIKNGVVGGVQLMQPIFMGGAIINGNELAKVGEAVAKLQKSQSEKEVKLTTEKYYWQLATLKSTRLTLLSALNMLDTLQNQVAVAVDAGVAMRNDLLKVQLKRDDYNSTLVDLDNGIKLFRMLLSQYIGADIERPVDIDAAVPETMPQYPADLFVDPSMALGQTIDYQLLQKNVEASRLELRVERGKNLPMVAAGAGWYFHNLLDQSQNFGALQIAVNIPISGWWGGSHAIKRKKISLLNAQIQLDDKSRMLVINMRDKWDKLTAAYRKMEIAVQSIDQSRENLRLNRLYYEAGTSTITDLLDAETLYRQALDRYSSSYGDYRCAIAEYLNATAR